jgi:hypothetical protein
VSNSNIKPTFFLKVRDSRIKQNHFTGSQGGNTCNRYNVSRRVYLLLVSNENVKPADILERLRAQFGDETHPRTYLKKAWKRLKTCGESWDSQGVLFVHFLTEQRKINAAYYSKLLKDKVKPAFRSKWRGRSAKSVCLLHDNARPHTAAVTTET